MPQQVAECEAGNPTSPRFGADRLRKASGRWALFALPLAQFLAGCLPIDPTPLHWGLGVEMACGDTAIRIHPNHGLQVNGIRMGDEAVAWDDGGGLVTEAWRQWTVHVVDGKHGYRLADTRYSVGKEGGRTVLRIVEESRPADDAETSWLAARDYAAAKAGTAPATHPIDAPWHRNAEVVVRELDCKTEDVPSERFGELTWLELLVATFGEWLSGR